MGKNFDLEKISVRHSVYLHARKMESRLREKDKKKGKDGWHDGNFNYYTAKVFECLKTVWDIIPTTIIGEATIHRKDSDMKEKEIHLAIKKCYDGSNFFMMLADNLRDELLKRGVKLHK